MYINGQKISKAYLNSQEITSAFCNEQQQLELPAVPGDNTITTSFQSFADVFDINTGYYLLENWELDEARLGGNGTEPNIEYFAIFGAPFGASITGNRIFTYLGPNGLGKERGGLQGIKIRYLVYSSSSESVIFQYSIDNGLNFIEITTYNTVSVGAAVPSERTFIFDSDIENDNIIVRLIGSSAMSIGEITLIDVGDDFTQLITEDFSGWNGIENPYNNFTITNAVKDTEGIVFTGENGSVFYNPTVIFQVSITIAMSPGGIGYYNVVLVDDNFIFTSIGNMLVGSGAGQPNENTFTFPTNTTDIVELRIVPLVPGQYGTGVNIKSIELLTFK